MSFEEVFGEKICNQFDACYKYTLFYFRYPLELLNEDKQSEILQFLKEVYALKKMWEIYDHKNYLENKYEGITAKIEQMFGTNDVLHTYFSTLGTEKASIVKNK